MLQRKEVFLLLLIIMMVFQVVARNYPNEGFVQDSVSKGVSQDEIILFNMINDIRIQSKLPSISLSASLCTVAHTHIDDLIKWRPQDKGCSLHSWSGSGKWTECCSSKGLSGIQCMKTKPREITGYAGSGYELIYWGEEIATPADAAAMWQQVEASLDMILSRGKWKGYLWKAIGVGIKDGYAVLWLGDKTDRKIPENLANLPAGPQPVPGNGVAKVNSSSKEKDPAMSENKVKKNETASGKLHQQPVIGPGINYYLVVASVKSRASAKSELKRIISKGYPDAFIVPGDSIYRIALTSYNSARQAAIKSNELKAEFPGIWIFRK